MELVTAWWHNVVSGDWHIEAANVPLKGTDALTITAVCLLIFPKLALGLSGFETGVAVMSLVKGAPTDTYDHPVVRHSQYSQTAGYGRR